MYRSIFIMLLCLFTFLPDLILGQQDFILGGDRTNKIRVSDSPNEITAKRIEIELSENITSGEWKVFKNWNEARAVFAENDSIVWVGTPVGLVRWNVMTRTYQTFDESNGLQFTYINSMVIDKHGKLWIAAKQGLATYSNGNFIHYNYLNTPLPQSAIEVVCIDSSNQVIVAFGPPLNRGWSYEGGIARFNGNDWQIWEYGSSIYYGPTYSIVTYHDTVWISGAENLFILTGDRLEVAPSWIWGGVTSMAIDFNDELCVMANNSKLLKLNLQGWQTIIESAPSSYDIWSDMSKGLWLENREIWWVDDGPFRLDFEKLAQGISCGTFTPGLCSIPDIPGQFYSHHAINATSQFFGSVGSGTTWPEFQVQQGGLYMFNGTDWQVFRITPTILQNELYGLGSDESGNVYLSTPFYSQKTNGLEWETIGGWVTGHRSWNRDFKFAPNGSLFTNHHQVYPNWDSFSGYVTGLDFDGYGNLWSAYPLLKYTWPGLYKTDYSSILNELAKPYRPQFMDVTVDKHEQTWAAAWYYGGVMYDRTNWHLFPPSDTTLPNYNYDLIFTDSNDRVWFGTNQSSPNYGFTIYDGIQWKTYYSPTRYAISYVYQISEDHLGNVWLATAGGLLKYDGQFFTLIDNENSFLSSNYTSAVTVDLRGNIWIGSREGLYVYNPGGPVELGSYTFESPVRNLVATTKENYVQIEFEPLFTSSGPVQYQLQRGRGIHKFWTIAETDFYSSVPQLIELVDQSNVIGKYYYRICEVNETGKVRYSNCITYSGKTPEVQLSDFGYFILGNELFLSWKTTAETFTNRFEIWCKDSLYGQFYLKKIIESDTSDILEKYYEIQIDTLGYYSQNKMYSLRVVYSDSSRAELKTISVLPNLPTSFFVSKNFPNPFNGSTNFNIELPVSGTLTFKLYDAIGREVKNIKYEMTEGFRTVQIELSSISSGVYFYSFDFLGKRNSGKLLYMK